MTRAEAEALRLDKRYWTWGIIYACRDDPRVIVRNRFVFGWTWNFAHPWALPALALFVGIALGPAAWLLARGVRDGVMLFAATTVSVLVLIGVAHYVASGPR